MAAVLIVQKDRAGWAGKHVCSPVELRIWNQVSYDHRWLTLGAGHLWVPMSPWGMDVKWYIKYFICWTADLKSIKLWSSQLWTKFKQLRTEARSRVQTPLKSWLFQASIRLNCVHNCDDHSLLNWFQIRSSTYEIFHISLNRACMSQSLTFFSSSV